MGSRRYKPSFSTCIRFINFSLLKQPTKTASKIESREEFKAEKLKKLNVYINIMRKNKLEYRESWQAERIYYLLRLYKEF
jgi:hypothetical protein